MKQSGPHLFLVCIHRDDAAHTSFRAIPNAAAQWNRMLPMRAGTVPMIGILCCTVEHSIAVSQPEDERGFASAISNVLLKVEHCRIHLLLQPLDRLVRMQRVHRRFQSSDDEGAIVDKCKRVLRPFSLMQAQEL